MPTDIPQPVRLVGLSGSIRRGSHCTAVLETIRDAIGAKADLTIFPLNDIPPYDPDEDGGNASQAVRDLRDAIARSDGVIVISPEYNYGMSGVLKNALDWASRPAMQSPVKGKPTLIMTASPAYTGGARAQYQMRETLAAMLARVIARPQVVVASVHEKIRDGRLVDQVALRFALAAVDDLLREIGLLRRARGT
ncbi:MAG TPA: NADPH-dependent FMN reductase [Alphaproteobacteria bacterium]|nr:NADPH-dependent FMN reductase [Alphaproteobacteria bacterium]